MNATQAAMMDDPGRDALEMLANLEQSAAAGEWQKVQAMASRVCDLILYVPEADRRDLLMIARRTIDKALSLAQYSSKEVAEKLSVIRRGRDATKAYSDSTVAYP